MSITDGFLGRNLQLTWNGNTILGVREKGVAINGEPVNVTSDEDDGWRKLLSEPGEKMLDLSISGVTKSNVLKTDWFANNRIRAVVLTYPNGDVIAGDFFLANFTDTGPYNDATTFEAELQSTGEFTFTAA